MAGSFKETVKLRHVYILEAHPVDGWLDADNETDGVCIRQPTTLQQRISAANMFVSTGARAEVLVDGMGNEAELAYEARPEKLVRALKLQHVLVCVCARACVRVRA